MYTSATQALKNAERGASFLSWWGTGGLFCGFLFYGCLYALQLPVNKFQYLETIIFTGGMGIVMGGMQAIAISKVSSRRSNVSTWWMLATALGYVVWSAIAKPITASSTTDSAFFSATFFTILLTAILIPGVIIGFFQACALKRKRAWTWVPIHTLCLFLAIGVPYLPVVAVSQLIDQANPDSPIGVIFFLAMFGIPAGLILAPICGCMAIMFSGRWLLYNVLCPTLPRQLPEHFSLAE